MTGKEQELKILFWNVSGIREKQYKGLSNYFEKFDIIVLTETLLEYGEEKYLDFKYESHRWITMTAETTEISRKTGGISIGIIENRESLIISVSSSSQASITNLMSAMRVELEFKLENQDESKSKSKNKKPESKLLTIFGVLKLKEKNISGFELEEEYQLFIDTLKYLTKSKKGTEDSFLIVGNFRALTNQENGFSENNEITDDLRYKRESKNSIEPDKNGEKLITMLKNMNNWGIINGSTRGDKEGELACKGYEGYSVIDYVITNNTNREAVKEMKVVQEEEIMENLFETRTLEMKKRFKPLEHRPLEIIFELCFNERPNEEVRCDTTDYNKGTENEEYHDNVDGDDDNNDDDIDDDGDNSSKSDEE